MTKVNESRHINQIGILRAVTDLVQPDHLNKNKLAIANQSPISVNWSGMAKIIEFNLILPS